MTNKKKSDTTPQRLPKWDRLSVSKKVATNPGFSKEKQAASNSLIGQAYSNPTGGNTNLKR